MPRWLLAASRRVSGSALGDALVVAYQTRLTGLAAEASFWGVFAIPWLMLGLVAGIVEIEQFLGLDVLDQVRSAVLGVANDVLTPEAVDELLVPLVDSILVRGQGTLGVVSIVAAIWAGSRLIDTLVDGMTIVYRREGLRSFMKTRLVSVAVYVGGLLALIVAIPLVFAGPEFLTWVFPDAPGQATGTILRSLGVALVLALTVSLYHWSVPHRTRWVADVPGAIIAMVLWVVFSFALRWYFAWLFREGSVYGVISAPIAVMYWVYVTTLALLLGAAFNGALALRRGWFIRGDGPTPEPPS